MLALRAPALPRRTYNVTGERILTLGDLAGIVRQLLPEADIAIAPGPDPLDDRQAEFDTRAARCDLGFRPEISLEKGIEAYADWLRERLAAAE